MFAGSTKGFGGDDGPAENARFAFAKGLAIDRGGDILVADYENCRIRRIDHRTMRISTIAGTGTRGSTGDGGPAVQASLTYPTSIATDSDGNIFFVDGVTRVRRIDRSGRITTYAGGANGGFSGDGGPADQAMLNNPAGLAVDSQGNLFISEYVNNRIRRVDAVTHIITTVAGTGFPHRIEVSL